MDLDLDLTELNHWLDQFMNFERRPDKNLLNLSTMRTLCEFFGHPEMAYPCFHIAGSKGKGTTAASISAILRTAGYRTGVYASPHVSHFTERVGTGEAPFPAKIYNSAFTELKSGIDQIIKTHLLPQNILTWYELVTMFAFLCFKNAQVDFAIIEVGMGGRLDATNVITPVCVAMGPIELEHTQFLGDTLAKIATEKAGVFKPHVPVVSAPQALEVQQVFQAYATRNHTSVTYVDGANYEEVDANLATSAVRQVLPDISPDVIATGLRQVSLPGRYEIFQSSPLILLDVAHTPNSIREVLARMARDHLSGHLLFGCSADKNVELIAKEIYASSLFSTVYLTRPGDFKKSDLPRIKKAFTTAGFQDLHVDGDFATFIPQVIRDSIRSRTPLVVLGSFYLVGEFKKFFNSL